MDPAQVGPPLGSGPFGPAQVLDLRSAPSLTMSLLFSGSDSEHGSSDHHRVQSVEGGEPGSRARFWSGRVRTSAPAAQPLSCVAVLPSGPGGAGGPAGVLRARHGGADQLDQVTRLVSVGFMGSWFWVVTLVLVLQVPESSCGGVRRQPSAAGNVEALLRFCGHQFTRLHRPAAAEEGRTGEVRTGSDRVLVKSC